MVVEQAGSTDPVSSEEWTADTLAQAASVSVVYIRRLCKKGTIKARKLGWAWLIPYEEGRLWLDERAAKSKSQDAALTTEA
jgi:hypothetical protein